jgi:porin
MTKLPGAVLALAIGLHGAGARADDAAQPSYSDTTLTGDWDGFRSRLRDEGVTVTMTQTSDGLGNVSGGLKRGAAYDGVFQLQGDFDMERLAGWTGGAIHVSGYAIQGQGLSGKDIGNLLTVTSVEADPGFRLGEFYLSQSLMDDKVTLKLGQILADQNFAISNTASLFVNSTFGWPGIFAEDLPGGGPAYPYAVPGAQIIVKPDDAWTLQAAIFNGSPTGSDPDGNANGLGFPLGDGVLAIAEAAYAYTPDKGGTGLPGTYKIGGWYNSERFDSLTTASNGLSLADPAASGDPRGLEGDFAVYAIADQTLWQEAGGAGSSLNGFVRVAIAPQQDRNSVSWYVDLGLAYKGLLPGRDNDIAGIGFSYAGMSSGMKDQARAENTFGGTSQPIPSSEAVIEATYQAAVTPWLKAQPFFQYVIRPGGNAPDPDKPNSRIQNAAIFGMRAVASF